MAAWRAGPAIAALLLASACSSGDAPPAAHTIGSVPRDARGDPVFSAIRQPPPEPPTVPMPAPFVATTAITTITSPEIANPAPGASSFVPTDPSQLLPPAKPISCRHLKRCP